MHSDEPPHASAAVAIEALLDRRLLALANFVPIGATVADIGCDHGQLPIALLKARRVTRAIGIDRASAPLAVAVSNAQRSGSSVELRHGDGLAALAPGEVDCITLAGVGGSAAVRILDLPTLSDLGVKRLVVQVNKKLPTVRRHLFGGGWRCAEEQVIRVSERFFVTCAFDAPQTAFGRSETAFGRSETAFGHSETAFGPLDLLVGPLIRRRVGPIEDAYIAHLRHWLESVEPKVGRSSPISAGATADMLRELEAERLEQARRA